MPLRPTSAERIARARADLRLGLGVVITTGAEAGLAFAVEALTADRLAAARGLGTPVIALTGRRAGTLKARIYDGDVARVAVPETAGAGWLRALADPAGDLTLPLKGPLSTLREGPAEAHRAAVSLCKSARLLPAALVVFGPSAEAGGRAAGLVEVSAAEVLARETALPDPAPVVSARLPMAAAEAGRLHLFRPDRGGEEHVAVEIGQPDRSAPVLARLHSACFTGDVLGSLKCDCGPQLNAALDQIGAAGSGVLLYLNQEGRGIGLANKMRAYALQDQGFDTVEANHRLGFEDDERDFRVGAAILRRLGFTRARLLTNNPAKVEMLGRCGVEVVERVPLRVGRSSHNAAYLATKAAKSGHLL